MEALHETIESDLANAINKAKKYQQQWKLIGPVSSYQRNKLWKRFRAACDVIFAKRQVNIDEKNSHIDELIREKEAICENLEALNLQPLNKKDLEVAFSDIRKLWSELQSQAKTLAKELNQRYTLAEKAYFKKLDELIIKEQANKLELIKAKAAICTQVEVQATLNDTISDDKYTQFEDNINQQWQHLESLPNTMESKLLARLNQAFKALQSQSKSQSQAIAIEQLQHTELKFKQDFCLQHEIRLGKESPAAEEQHRMQMQIELLNKKMGQNQMISQFEMQFQWYQFSNYTQDGMLEVRFSNLLVRDS